METVGFDAVVEQWKQNNNYHVVCIILLGSGVTMCLQIV